MRCNTNLTESRRVNFVSMMPVCDRCFQADLHLVEGIPWGEIVVLGSILLWVLF